MSQIITTKKANFLTSNWIYDKTPYVWFQILPKPWELNTIQDGVDGDIFQACPMFVSSFFFFYFSYPATGSQ